MATVEYTALAFLVAAALAVGGAVVDARAVPDAVGAQLRRAYCLVQGGDCLGRAGPRPCVVRSRTGTREVRVALALLRLRDGRTVLREERSDGTVQVTVVQGDGASAATQLGLDVRVGGRAVRIGGDVQAGLDATFGRTYVVADGAAADRLIARLAESDAPAGGGIAGLVRFLRAPRDGRGEASRTVTVSSRGEAEAALKALGVGGRTDLVAGVTTGLRVDGAGGAPTLLLGFPRATTAELTAPLVRAGAGLDAAVDVEVALGPGRRPVELLVRGRGSVRGRTDGLVREVELRLDLGEPAVRALAGRLLHGDAGAARALAARLAEGARVDVREFATTRRGSTKGAMVKAGGGLGGEVATTTATARLVAARGREPGQGWASRLDCLLGAG